MIKHKAVSVIYTQGNVTLKTSVKRVHPPSGPGSVLQPPAVETRGVLPVFVVDRHMFLLGGPYGQVQSFEDL